MSTLTIYWTERAHRWSDKSLIESFEPYVIADCLDNRLNGRDTAYDVSQISALDLIRCLIREGKINFDSAKLKIEEEEYEIITKGENAGRMSEWPDVLNTYDRILARLIDWDHIADDKLEVEPDWQTSPDEANVLAHYPFGFGRE